MIEIPFGFIAYFLALEDEKPVLFVEIATRMDSDDIIIIDDNGYVSYDIYDAYPEEIKDRYFGHLKKIGKKRSRFRSKTKD